MRYIPPFVKYFIPDGWTHGDRVGVADASNRKDCEKKFEQFKRCSAGSVKRDIDPTVLTIENNPIDSVRLLKITEYRKYGSDWDILTPLGYTFTINDSLIFDCARYADISLGEIKAPLIWVNDSGISLTRVGSNTHTRLLAEDAKLNAGTVKQEFGCVYKTKSGQEYLFLGKMDGVDVKSYDNPNYHYGYSYGYNNRNAGIPRYLYKYVPESGFLYLYGDSLPDLSGHYYSDSLTFCKTRKPMYEFVKDLKLQPDWLDKLKEKAATRMQNRSTLNLPDYELPKIARILNLGAKDKVHAEVDKIFAPLGTKFS